MEEVKKMHKEIKENLQICADTNSYLQSASSLLDSLEQQLEKNRSLSQTVDKKIRHLNQKFGDD